MTELLRRSLALELRAEGRTLTGVVVPYGSEITVGGYREQFARGAFADVDPAGVPLLVAHRHAALPIGRSTTLVDDERALTGTFALSATRDADEVLSLVGDGVRLGLSVGFAPSVDRWNADRTSVVRVRARLAEVSVVGVPAYPDAQVTGVRSAGDVGRPLTLLARLLG